MSADRRAAQLVFGPLFPTKTTTCCSVYELVQPQLSCYKKTTSLFVDSPQRLFAAAVVLIVYVRAQSL